MTRGILALAGLVAVWLLTLASASWEDALIGAALGGAVGLGLRPPPIRPRRAAPGPTTLSRLIAAPALLAVVVADIVHGTWDVALRVLGLRPLDRPGIVLIPIGDRSEFGIAVTGLLFGLSPGSVLLEVDEERRTMLWHVIDARDPEAVRARFEDMYQRHQRRVVP